MPKPFDATLKELVRAYPADWLARVGVPVTAADPPEVLAVDLSTVTTAADTLIRVGGRVVHIEIESGPDDGLARRVLRYNVLAHERTGLPVRSAVVLLRSNTMTASLTDRVEYEQLRFRFELVKLWEVPSEELLRGGVGLTPLAVLGKPPPGTTRAKALAGQLGRIADRAEQEAPADAAKLMAATYVLASVHVEPAAAWEVMTTVLNMRDFPGYQFLLNEGAVVHARKLIVKLGSGRLGPPTEAQSARIDAIDDLDRLDRIVLKAPTARDWDALLRTR
ncbi:MAG: hypothetical protein K2X82_02760 [Gemmataceae bacterium]|nr:hypothetical protein [Gemmataceae bacterium]